MFDTDTTSAFVNGRSSQVILPVFSGTSRPILFSDWLSLCLCWPVSRSSQSWPCVSAPFPGQLGPPQPSASLGPLWPPWPRPALLCSSHAWPRPTRISAQSIASLGNSSPPWHVSIRCILNDTFNKKGGGKNQTFGENQGRAVLKVKLFNSCSELKLNSLGGHRFLVPCLIAGQVTHSSRSKYCVHTPK